MSKKAKTPGVCVFCGKSGVTKQHMWPDWVKNVIPREGEKHTQLLTHINMAQRGLALIHPDIQNKRGPAGARKIRNVCNKCNSGWMSKLEGSAKNALTNAITNQAMKLDSSTQEAIAAWAMMTSIVAEYTDTPSQAIPATDREYLMRELHPDEHWRIWMGRYDGAEWKQRYRHTSLVATWDWGHWPTVPAVPNTQSSTFVVGSLFLVAMSSSFIPTDQFPYPSSLDGTLIQIWPTNSGSEDWPPKVTINDAEADIISRALGYKFMPNNSFGHPSRWRLYGA